MKLFKIECRKTMFSFVYLLFLLLISFNWYNNFAGVTSDEIKKTEKTKTATEEFFKLDRPLLKEPSENDDFCGTKFVENPHKIMRGATDKLLSEYKENLYAVYPFGYYKAISLNEREQKRVLEILCEITGLTEKQLLNLPEGYFPSVNGTIIHIPEGEEKKMENTDMKISISDDDLKTEDATNEQVFIPQVSYEIFKERMSELEKMLGRGSNYSMEILISYYGMEEMSYEEAVKEFQTTINDDRVSGGFARLFCDSMSSAMGLLPVFLIVFLWMYDLKAKSSSLIYVKKLSSKKIIFTRFLSVLILVLIPNFLLSLESLIPLSKFALRNGYDINYFAYTKYIIFWLLPTIMIVLALGTFLTVITDSPIAILIQLIWWFVDRGMTGLSGDTDLYTLMLRHNTLRGSEIINAQSGMILTNRLLYMALSFIFLEITVIVFEKKRRGKFDFWRHYTEYYNAIKRKL